MIVILLKFTRVQNRSRLTKNIKKKLKFEKADFGSKKDYLETKVVFLLLSSEID